MIIGIPRETRPGETRVAATPETVKKLAASGRHDIVVEAGAGQGSSITDDQFTAAGARIGSLADALGADVVLHIDVSHPEELRKARSRQGMVRYELTLTDRRSGAVLGVQSFVVDQVNGRACGANVDGNISQDAFIYDAIHR